MTALRPASVALMWLMVLAASGGYDAFGQSAHSEPWWEELGHEPFTHAYVRGRAAAAAATLLQEDPFNVRAVTLLMRAGRIVEAITLVEQIGQARPDQLVAAFEALQEPYAPPWDPKAEAMTARLKALREQIGRAPKSAATVPEHSNKPVVAGRPRDDVSERVLLDAQKQLERATESLSKQKKWSVRDVGAALAPGLKLLSDMAETDRGPYGRQALELMARTEFEAGQLREAFGHFALIEQRYPDSEVAWAAAMRAAQLAQSLGDTKVAAKAFARVGAVYAAKPTVPALASFYEARAYEALAHWADALVAYRTAIDAWPANDTDWMGLDWKVLYFSDPFVESLWPRYISRRDVVQRIKVLTHIAAVPSQAEIERATWLLDHRRPAEARELLLRLAQTHQVTMPVPSLRAVLHRAEVDTAVSAISRDGRLSREANRALRRLCGEPFDAWVGIGCAIHASVLAVDGQVGAAETGLRQAFRRWVEAQSGEMRPSTPENEIARDAIAIQHLLFEPDGAYGLRGQAKAYTPPPFIFMPSALRVTTGQGAHSLDIEAQTPHGRSNVILLSELQARTLWGTVEQLSACDGGRRSNRLYRSWYATVGFSKMFCALAGSGYTAPLVGPIHFMNPERTRAHVIVTEGAHSDGAHVAVVEKLDGEWKVTGSAGFWQY